MEEVQQTLTETVPLEGAEPPKEEKKLTPEEQEKETIKIAEFRYRSLASLLKIYIQHFCAVMVSSNGVPYKDKVQAVDLLTNGLLAGLDMGVDLSNPTLLEKGKNAKEQANLGAVVAQMIDMSTVIKAFKLKQKESQINNLKQEKETDGGTAAKET
jgi:hypothetical protein